MKILLTGLLTLSVFFCFSQSANESIAGVWRVAADQQVDDLGKVIAEDTAVSGLLIYTPEGKMSVQILWRGRRAIIMNDTIMSRDGISSGLGLGSNTWTTSERASIIDTYDAYFGNYIVDKKNNIVTHIVRGNLRPEKSGVAFDRKFRHENGILYLRSVDPKMKWQMKFVLEPLK